MNKHERLDDLDKKKQEHHLEQMLDWKIEPEEFISKQANWDKKYREMLLEAVK